MCSFQLSQNVLWGFRLLPPNKWLRFNISNSPQNITGLSCVCCSAGSSIIYSQIKVRYRVCSFHWEKTSQKLYADVGVCLRPPPFFFILTGFFLPRFLFSFHRFDHSSYSRHIASSSCTEETVTQQGVSPCGRYLIQPKQCRSRVQPFIM